MKKNFKKIFVVLSSALLFASCQTQETEEKTFIYGTTAYSVANADVGLNPHSDYSGWSSVRYGVGETLFKYSETMQLTPWLATEYEQVDELTWEITLRDDVQFSSGRALDSVAVKECIENLIAVHDRAPYDLKIDSINADGQKVTFKTTEPVPAFINYLSDPYAAIIDMEYGVTEDDNVAGTGPFVAEAVSETEITLNKNENYWGGEVKTDRVIVKSITDGDTLTLALQSGEIDAAQGLPYASIPIFSDDTNYKISSADTSRAFFAQTNGDNELLSDINVRQAIAMSIDKNGFTEVLLDGNGSKALGPFPQSMTDESIIPTEFDIEGAKALLEQAGYTDSDGDGYRERDGEKLTLRWLTYPSRQELPLLAELAHSNLRDIGIDLVINSTSSHNDFIASGEWDIYASAFVTAPTGDLQYFFTTHALESSAKNRGGFYNEEIENLNNALNSTFDTSKRYELAQEMSQILLNEYEFIFVSHLKMSLVMKENIAGFVAHPSDYYEITADLEIL